MSEQATSTGSPTPEEMSDPELRAELMRERQEVLRLRDILVRKDAELGAAKGRLAELDDRSQRIASAAARVEAKLPGFGRLVGTVLRVLQGQRR